MTVIHFVYYHLPLSRLNKLRAVRMKSPLLYKNFGQLSKGRKLQLYLSSQIENLLTSKRL
jgi:hypothetical protein